ncbi:hypothetical protein N7493_007459 [Penicillium malachiteum]|uniref:RING-type domain-containing protein n=1 Tax=Penicillium malachiteum TaxID=1324776 RepID=A0AAD6MU85_9EURO|nr:hypothetical protein N7493_007459 [Penicillium malachiteum]
MSDLEYSPELQRLIDTLELIPPEIAQEVVAGLEGERNGGVMFALPAHILQYPMDDENHRPTTFIEWVSANFDMVDEDVAREIGQPISSGGHPDNKVADDGTINWRPIVWGIPENHEAPEPICEHCLDLLPQQPADATIIAENPSCPICTEAYEVEVPILTLPCGHLFHEQCVQIWLRRSSSCPLCRRVIKNL